MKLLGKILAVTAIGLGMTLLVKAGDALWVSGVNSYTTATGDTVWIPLGRDGYTTMIYLALLFLLYPVISFTTHRRRR